MFDIWTTIRQIKRKGTKIGVWQIEVRRLNFIKRWLKRFIHVKDEIIEIRIFQRNIFREELAICFVITLVFAGMTLLDMKFHVICTRVSVLTMIARKASVLEMKLVVPFKVFFSLKTSTMSLKGRTYKTWVCSILFFCPWAGFLWFLGQSQSPLVHVLISWSWDHGRCRIF